MKKMRAASLIVLMLVSATLLPSTLVPSVHAQTEVTVTEHVRLGFDATFTFNEGVSDDWGGGGITYDFGISGEANIRVDMGVDITLTYDRADILPGQPMQLQITYTPTDDPGPEISVDASATLTADVDVAWWVYLLSTLAPPLFAALATLDSIDAELDDFDLAVGSADFTAPLNGDPDVVVAGASDTAVLSFLGLDIVGASLTSSFTLSPILPRDFPVIPIGGGAGGAVAFIDVIGAGLTTPSRILGIGPGILEWGTAGETFMATIELPSGPGTVDAVLEPVLHWLETSANLDLNLDLRGVLDDIFGDRTINIFSGSLGSVYQQVGLDVQIGDAVASMVGFDPGFATLVGTGDIPVPLLEPEIDAIGAGIIPTFGSRTFSFDLDSDGDGLFDGTEIAIGTDPDDSDSDDDGLTDGEEVNVYGTDPLDADSDDDGLTDGDEVNVYGTDPLDPDSDDDGLTDGDEVNVYGTDPLDPDTDDDELIDGLEVEYGTDPLDPDTDDDGIIDGEDVEWLQNAIDALPNSAFKDRDRRRGLRNAMINILNDVELAVASSDIDEAMELVTNLRRHVDGCGLSPDRNDWIVDCTAQIEIRELIDIYIVNLS